MAFDYSFIDLRMKNFRRKEQQKQMCRVRIQAIFAVMLVCGWQRSDAFPLMPIPRVVAPFMRKGIVLKGRNKRSVNGYSVSSRRIKLTRLKAAAAAASDDDDDNDEEDYDDVDDLEDDSDGQEEEDIDFLFEEPPKILDGMERAWRYASKPLLRIGSKGANLTHGNSLRQLLEAHGVVKVKVNTRRFDNSLETAFEQIKELAEEAGAPPGIELVQARERDHIILFGSPGICQRISNGEFPPPPPPPRPSQSS